MILLEIPPNIDPDVVRPGWGALLLVLGLGVVLALLLWSMVRHMRRIDVPYADEVQGANRGVQNWGEEMRAKSPDYDAEDEPASRNDHPVS
ncbi:hypothetical protein [Enemella sp. A6]|uniref:hypothetical protein n=1 Tax=Enemella sp. A6 TaxID=3440152 RepID=UPI003EBBB35A